VQFAGKRTHVAAKDFYPTKTDQERMNCRNYVDKQPVSKFPFCGFQEPRKTN
jgi:hypothetical protein